MLFSCRTSMKDYKLCSFLLIQSWNDKASKILHLSTVQPLLSGHLLSGHPPLKPGFHMIVWIVPVISKKMFRRSRRSYGNTTQTITNDPHDWDDLDRLDRIEFYSDDRDHHVNFDAIAVVCDCLGSISIWSSWSSEHFLRQLGRSGWFGRSYGNQA